MAHMHLRISGMSCDHCIAAVERALDRLEGVQKRQGKVGSAEVDYDPARTSPERINQAVRTEGYEPEVA